MGILFQNGLGIGASNNGGPLSTYYNLNIKI